MQQFNTLEQDIQFLKKDGKYIPLSVEDLLKILSGKGKALLLILLSLPFCQPVQIPGFSTIFGILIAFLGCRMAFGKRVWLPQSILSKVIPAHTLEKIGEGTLKFLKKVKRFIHPRWEWMIHEFVNGIIIFALGILLALPLPIPLTNLVAAWAILLISLGIIEDDGLFLLLGYLTFIIVVVFFGMIAFSIKYFV